MKKSLLFHVICRELLSARVNPFYMLWISFEQTLQPGRLAPVRRRLDGVLNHFRFWGNWEGENALINEWLYR